MRKFVKKLQNLLEIVGFRVNTMQIVNEITGGEQPEPLEMPGFDAGIPTSG